MDEGKAWLKLLSRILTSYIRIPSLQPKGKLSPEKDTAQVKEYILVGYIQNCQLSVQKFVWNFALYYVYVLSLYQLHYN